MALGHSEFRHGPGETGKPYKKAVYVVVSQGNSGNKGKSNNCVEFSVFNIFS